MSRGPGRIERAIAAILDAEPDNAFTTADLCDRIYPGRIEKKHRVAVLRAAKSLMKRRDTLSWFGSGGLGGERVFFTIDNVMSYAMAREKSDSFNNYRSNDQRIYYPKTEADLRAKLTDPNDHGKYIQPGGAWWEFTQENIAELEAERSGDAERIERVRRENEAKHAARMAAIWPT